MSNNSVLKKLHGWNCREVWHVNNSSTGCNKDNYKLFKDGFVWLSVSLCASLHVLLFVYIDLSATNPHSHWPQSPGSVLQSTSVLCSSLVSGRGTCAPDTCRRRPTDERPTNTTSTVVNTDLTLHQTTQINSWSSTSVRILWTWRRQVQALTTNFFLCLIGSTLFINRIIVLIVLQQKHSTHYSTTYSYIALFAQQSNLAAICAKNDNYMYVLCTSIDIEF